MPRNGNFALVTLGLLFLGASTAGFGQTADSVPFPTTRFMVLSDTHLYDASLGTSGKAWEDYLADDRKLLKDSNETLQAALHAVENAKPDFLLVSGDLTKDGERQCHELIVQYLTGLKEKGIPSYVIPGNHDINNPNASRFLPSGGKERVPAISPEEFVQLYADFGYKQALARDTASLSYVVEPSPGLWLMALDSCQYETNYKDNYPKTAGAIRPATYTWIESQLKEAVNQKKTVMVTLHHPILEHFDGMLDKYPEYVLNDHWRLANLLGSYNVKIVFSGHFHASSIVMHKWDNSAPDALKGKFLVDIETGSLVTWPCSYRTIQLSPDGSVTVRTDRVAQLPSYAAAGKSFDVEGKRIIVDGISNIATATMKQYWVSNNDIDRLVPQIANAMMAHYHGDAHFDGTEPISKNNLSLMGNFVVMSYDRFIHGVWKMRAPDGVLLMADNNLVLNPDGSWLRHEDTF